MKANQIITQVHFVVFFPKVLDSGQDQDEDGAVIVTEDTPKKKKPLQAKNVSPLEFAGVFINFDGMHV